MKVTINDFGIILDGEYNTIGGIEVFGYDLVELKNFIIIPGNDILSFKRPQSKLKVDTYQLEGFVPCKSCNGYSVVVVNKGDTLLPISENGEMTIPNFETQLCPHCKSMMSN